MTIHSNLCKLIHTPNKVHHLQQRNKWTKISTNFCFVVRLHDRRNIQSFLFLLFVCSLLVRNECYSIAFLRTYPSTTPSTITPSEKLCSITQTIASGSAHFPLLKPGETLPCCSPLVSDTYIVLNFAPNITSTRSKFNWNFRTNPFHRHYGALARFNQSPFVWYWSNIDR